MTYNSRADVIRFWAERYDTKPNVKSGRFRSQLQASYLSGYTAVMQNSPSVDDNITYTYKSVYETCCLFLFAYLLFIFYF